MAKCSEEIVYEGWLTKSPPTKRIWRARWRRRWFMLTHSGDIPGQYVLTYYTDRNCRKLKGVIDLDHCEQVDLGLKLEERNLKFDHVFDIKTPHRTYYLAADTEEEMKCWVTCICKVCGLKSTHEEEELSVAINTKEIEITEETDKLGQSSETPPISPVSTSPYIPISECITGKSPIFDPKDFKTLLDYNRRNSNRFSPRSNQSYELPPSKNYINFGHEAERNYINDMQDPRFYDCPRKLHPQMNKPEGEYSNHSPLQSPTDSDSVFNEEEWGPNSELGSLKKPRASDSSIEPDPIATQKFTKVPQNSQKQQTLAPPRPPKPPHITPPPSYTNLTPTKSGKENEDKEKLKHGGQKIITDDMYDFPRSHNVETEQGKGTLPSKHCYNNAAPVKCPEGTIFRYDISPKPSTSSVTSVFRYDLEATQELEPSSPAHSHSSSTPGYSNLPSPLLAETQLMPPPTVNRELKPRRKLSDTHSTSSNTEPPSPRSTAPSVDRKLKPPTPLQEAHMRKSFQPADEEGSRKIRAAPSPTPPSLSGENLYENQGEVYHYISGKMQYLDLDLEGTTSSNATKTLPKTEESVTVYKKVDFMKTQAFNITRNNLERERQEPVTSFTKK